MGGRYAPDANFYQLVESGQEHFDSLGSGADEEEGEEGKEGPEVYFQRWKSDWEGRIGGPGIGKYEAGSFQRIDAMAQQLTDMEICAGTASNSSDWEFVGPDDRDQHDKGIVVSVAKHPDNNDIFYAGTNASGLWKTTDDGATWTNVTNQLNVPGMGVQSIAIDPQDPSTVYIGTGVGGFGRRYGIGVLKSTDGGSNWKQTDLTYEPGSYESGKRVFDLAIHPDETSKIYALVNESVYISDNGGAQFDEEWSIPCPPQASGCCDKLKEKRMLRDIEFLPYNPDVIFISSDDKNAFNDNDTPIQGPVCSSSQFDGGARVWLADQDFNNTTDITPAAYEGTNSSGWETGSDRLTIDVSAAPNHNDKLFVLGRKGNGGRELTVLEWSSSSPANQAQPDNTYAFSSNGEFGSIKTGGVFTHELEVSDENSSSPDEIKVYIGGVGYLTAQLNLNTEIADWINTSGDNNNIGTQNWSTNSNWHQDVRALLVYEEDGEEYIVQGNDGGISRSSDGDFRAGESMNGDGLDITQFYGLGVYEEDADFIAGGTQDNQSFRYYDQNWNRKGTNDMGDVEINDETGEMVSTSWPGWDLATASYPLSGGNWSESSENTEQNNFPNEYFFGLGQGGTGTLISGFRKSTNQKAILKDQNNNTIIFDKSLAKSSPVGGFVQAPSDANRIYAFMKRPTWGEVNQSAKHKLWKSTDGGNSWQDISDFSNGSLGNSFKSAISWHGISDITIDPNNPDRIWMVTNRFNDPIDEPVNKVLFSDDGGNSWTDISGEGDLPGVPMHEIVYQKGSDDHLYVATEVGVFHNEDAEPEKGGWECFSNELPTVTVTDLEINYCGQEIWASTYGRGIWRSQLPSIAPKTISSNTTWYQDKDVHRDIIVENGAIFSIWGTVNMADGKRIIVEPGARLIVKGKVTNKCGRLWRGVEVRGNYHKPQTYDEQGSLLVDGGTVENANTAVETNKEDPQGNVDYSKTGGIVKARDATFRNNRRAVEFLSYQNSAQGTSNLSDFNNCTFVTDQEPLNEDRDPEAFITMWDVKGIQIDGCDFKYTASQDDFIPEDRGKGIEAINAGFSVDNAFQGIPPDVTKDRSHFEGLHYGIEAASINFMNSVDVEDAVFTDNIRGIYLKGVDNAEINRNSFTLDNSVPSTYDTYGTYFYGCNDYGYKENSFEADGGFSHGTLIYNPAQDAANTNWVYKNEYGEDVTFSQVFMGNNAGTDPSGESFYPGKGLKFDCNTYHEAMSEDVWITYHGKGVSIRQGVYDENDPTAPVANRLKGCPGGELDLRHDGTAATEDDVYMDYYHHDQSVYTPGNNCYSDPEVDPDGVLSNNPSHDEACPDQVPEDIFPGGIHQDPVVGDLQVAIRGLKELSAETQYQARTLSKEIDGNDTQGLLDTVHGEFDSESDEEEGIVEKEALMRASPYLSDTVLLAAIDAGLPHSILKDVLIANSPLVDSVHEDFQNKEEIPDRFKDNVGEEQEGVSPRMELKSKIAHYRARSEWLLDRVVREYVHHDSIPGRLDSLERILKDGRRNDASFRLVQLYDEQGEYEKAKELLNKVEANEPAYQKACDLQRTLIELHEEEKSVMALKEDADKEATVRNVAEAAGQKGSIRARAILEAVFGEELEEVFPDVSDKTFGGDGKKDKEEKQQAEKEGEASVRLHPNPTREEVKLRFKGEHREERWRIELRDLSGRKVKASEVDGSRGARLSTDELRPGIYFVIMRSERSDETLSRKLIVQER